MLLLRTGLLLASQHLSLRVSVRHLLGFKMCGAPRARTGGFYFEWGWWCNGVHVYPPSHRSLGVNWLVYLYECTLYSVYLYQCTLYSVYLYQCTLYIWIRTFVHMVHVSHNVQLYEE